MPEQETTVVVGVGPGLGSAVARRFAAGGHAVALVARDPAHAGPARDAITDSGGRAAVVPADATDPASVAQAFGRAREELGPPSVLVYNAGAFVRGGILDIEPEQFEATWRANCMGAFLAAREALPPMLERGRGTIVLTGATAALRGGAGFSCLAVGKFGLRALAQSMAREFGPRGIHVAHVIVDGQIDTPKIHQREPGRERHTLLSPDAIAETYWQLHHQDATAWTLELDLRPAVEKF